MPIKAVSVPPFRGDHSQSMTPQFHGSPLFPAGGGERPSAEYHQLAQDPAMIHGMRTFQACMPSPRFQSNTRVKRSMAPGRWLFSAARLSNQYLR
ncbi:hypothetical protein PCANC_15530 [Puccinia coronata f. sp. avenae]|uniref:Uncharacterized protein n=1 Tax=Puccinia coronata f. sp. avenae TaxID=200324 RepID=A0A2N5SIQ3_9BASI|nr:hypothetical protein PCANC_15530 [Puccinia coronata f. sp. avenae]